MKVSHVLTAVNNNPLYTRFIPSFIKLWKESYPTIQIVIVYIGSEIPSELLHYKEHLILYNSIPGVHDVFLAQTIRLLYPCLLDTSEGVLITDMDMLPGRSTFFYDCVKDVPDDKFVSVRGGESNQLYMCYNIAKPLTWRNIFGIHHVDDVEKFMKKFNAPCDGVHGGRGWFNDQLILYYMVNQWKEKQNRFVQLNDTITNFSRLHIHYHQYDFDKLKILYRNNSYADCHLYACDCPWSKEQLNQL
jgi:hypothetical protein